MPPTMIFAVTGEPGVGKTTLLRRMRAEVRDTVVTAWAGGPGYHPLTVIRRLAAELARHVDTSELDRALAAQADAVRRWGPLPVVPARATFDARRSRIDHLTPLLIDAIDRTIEHGSMVVLFLDDVGWPDDEVANWLVDVMGGVYGQFHPEFLVVIAGEAACTGPLVRYPFAVTPLGLARFSAEETEAVLAARDLPLHRAAAVHVDSGGLPAFVDLLAHPWLATRTGVGRRDSADPVAHLIDTLPDRDLARPLLRTAVPRWTDAPMRDAIYHGRRRDDVVDWLRAAPASFPPTHHSPGRHWHPAVRDAFVGHLRAHEPRRLQAAHRRLALHHERRWLDLGATGEVAYRHRVEADYHAVAADEAPTRRAAIVSGRVLEAGPAAAPSMVAVEQALRERGASDAAHRALVGAVLADDVAGAVELVEHLHAAEHPMGPAERRGVSLTRWAVAAGAAEIPTHADPPAPWVAVAQAWHEGRHADVEQAATDALDRSPDDGWLLAVRGDARLRSGDAAGAETDLVRAARLLPHLAWVHARLGIASLVLGRSAVAVDHLTRAVLGDPEPIVVALRGEARRRRGDVTGAGHDLRWSLDRDARSPWIHRSLALVASAVGDDGAAARCLLDAGALAPRSPHVFALRAEARRRIGDVRGSLVDMSKALSLLAERGDERAVAARLLGPADQASPLAGLHLDVLVESVDCVALHLARAQLHGSLGDVDAAEQDLDAAVDLAPNRPETRRARARHRAARQDLVRALTDAERWVAVDADNPAAHAQHGQLCLATGDAAGAVESFGRAVALEPRVAMHRALRGAGRRALGDPVGTIQDHTAAIRLGAAEHWVRGQRGEAYLRLGDRAAASVDVAAALAQSPDEPWLLELQRRIAESPDSEVAGSEAAGN